MKQTIAKELLNAWDDVGKKTKFQTTIDKYTGRISTLKNALKEVKLRNKAVNDVLSDIERMTNYTKYVPAEVGERFPQVVNFVKKVKSIKTWRNNLSQNAREALKDLPNLYTQIAEESNPVLGVFSNDINEIASGEGELSTRELVVLSNIFKKFYTHSKKL